MPLDLVFHDGGAALFRGDSRHLPSVLAPDSVDAFVSDPPAGIGFMGKRWDKGERTEWIARMAEIFAGVLSVLKPGAHGLVWALPRTSHWTMTALEDAGFEVRDRIAHLFGTGFPKSMNISKALDKRGSELTAQWDGWGTALKPACEDWILVRKPFTGALVDNVLEHGVGGLNIDACRIEHVDEADRASATPQGKVIRGNFAPGTGIQGVETNRPATDGGRWPANLILDPEAAAMLDAQAGPSTSRKGKPRKSAAPGDGYGMTHTGAEYSDSGGPSRFFYVAKPSRAERDAGLAEAGIEPKTGGEATGRKDGSAGTQNPRAGAGRTGGARNTHPTVKSITLMKWLIQLITPPGGLVLDAFAGSGSTGVAAIELGCEFVGCDLDEDDEYISIAKARIEHAIRARDRQAFDAAPPKKGNYQ